MAYLPCHRLAFQICATTSGPNIPNRSPITSPNPPSTNFNPHSKEPFSTARTNTPRHSAYTAHVSTTNPLQVPFKTCPSLNHFLMNHPPLWHRWLNHSIASMAKLILGQSALADNFQLGISWPNERKTFRISLSTDAQHPCSAHLSTHPVCLSRPLCHRGCVHIVVYPARSACRCWPHFGQPGFGRFLYQHWPREIYPIMVHAPGLPSTKDECLRWWSFSVYPGKSNNPGDIIKGRTFRRLNVTRKIVIKHVPDLIKSALDMQTFALGQRCVRQCRGSPMGSPLSPALCLMVVSISEQIWSNTFRHLMSNHHLFIPHIRYVDNRLIFGDKRLTELAPYEVLLDEGFYGKPIILETEPDQEFLGFMLETKPLELIYQGPTNISQVLSPFSASPPAVLLSGFRSRCHIVIKGAFPASRVQQGLTQLIQLYSRAGFPKEELQTISDQLLIQHQNFPSQCQTRAFCLHTHVLSCFPVLFWFSFSVSFLGYALGSFSCVAVFPCALFGSFLAQSSLALSFLLCIPDGSRPSSRFPSPPGSGSDTFELFGGAPSLFRALHWMGGLFASSNSSSWQHEITKLAHLRSFTSIVSATNIGYTWRDPVPHGGKSWTKPSSHHLSSSNSHGKGPSIHKSSRCSHSSSHVGSKSKSRPSGQHSIWTWSFPEHDSGSSPLQAKGIIHHWPTTKEATKSIQPSGYRSIQGTRYFSSRSASDFLRCSYQYPQFWRLWWWWRINSGLRSRPWPSLCSSWRVYISRYHSSG